MKLSARVAGIYDASGVGGEGSVKERSCNFCKISFIKKKISFYTKVLKNKADDRTCLVHKVRKCYIIYKKKLCFEKSIGFAKNVE